MLSTTVQDSQGNYPDFDVQVEGKTVRLRFKEALTAGETYSIVFYANSAQDIFYNSVSERISFTVSIKDTAVVQAPRGAAISIVANAYDNLNVSAVKLYYRIKGQTEYSCVDMYCNANAYGKYTATIPAGIVTADGVEYYIEASDGRQSATVYSATAPQSIRTYKMYSVTVITVTGGRITVSKTRAKAGDYVTVTATADNGYAYLAQSLKYVRGGKEYTVEDGGFIMPDADVEIRATFVAESSYAYGDINRDGVVNSADAILLLRYDAGLESLDQEQLLLADVNRDGKIMVRDANEILRIDAGL